MASARKKVARTAKIAAPTPVTGAKSKSKPRPSPRRKSR